MKKKPARRAKTRQPKRIALSKTASIAVPFRRRGSFGPDATNVILDDGSDAYPADKFQRGYAT